MCFVVTCWERADLLALVCGVLLSVCHFPIGILGQVWYLIISIPDLCTLTYFYNTYASKRSVGMVDSDSPFYVACRTIQLHDPEQESWFLRDDALIS